MVKTTSQLVLFFLPRFSFSVSRSMVSRCQSSIFSSKTLRMARFVWSCHGQISMKNRWIEIVVKSTRPGYDWPKKKLGMEAMGLIEIDGLPFWISWWFFSSRTVKEPDGTLIDWVDQFKWSINSTINMLRKNTFTIQSSIVVDAIQKNTSRNHFTLWEFVA